MADEKASGIRTPTHSNEEMRKETIDRIRSLDPNGPDIFRVRGGDKKFQYYWGNTRKEMLEQMKFAKGFEVVNKDNDPNVETIAKQSDGSHTMGDAILLRRPIELEQEERRQQREREKRMRKRPKEEMREEAAKLRMKTLDD